MTDAKKQKTGGRKPGSKNKDRSEVLHIPATCRNCGGTDFTVQRIVDQKRFVQIIDSKLYNQTTLRDVRCNKCEYYSRVRMLENVPE